MSSSWSTFKQALRGDVHEDFTSAELRRSIVLLAVPMVGEMLMESVFAIWDIFIVSRLGADAVTAVGITESVMALVYAVAIGLCMGVTAIVARRTGEKDPEGAARAAAQAIFLGLGLSALIGAVGAFFAPDLLRAMGASEGVIATGSGFTRLMIGGNASVFMLFLINAVFRGVGDATIAMRSLWLANSINIVLCPTLVFGVGPIPALGVTGAALATTIGRSTGVIYQIIALTSGKRRITLGARHLRLEPQAMATMIRVGSTGFLQFFIGSASWLFLVRIVTRFGSEVVAGYTVAMRVVMFAMLPAWGLSNASATLVGQNLGAGKPERSEQAVWLSARYCAYFLTGIGIIFVVFAGPIVSLFGSDPHVAEWAERALRTFGFGFPLYGWGMIMTSAFNGAGDTWTPTAINFCIFWVFEIPLAYVLATRTELAAMGVFMSVTLAFSTLAIVGVIMFRRGTWKTKKV